MSTGRAADEGIVEQDWAGGDLGGSSAGCRRIACAVTDLPEPDLPTRATVVALRLIEKVRPSTARKPA